MIGSGSFCHSNSNSNIGAIPEISQAFITATMTKNDAQNKILDFRKPPLIDETASYRIGQDTFDMMNQTLNLYFKAQKQWSASLYRKARRRCKSFYARGDDEFANDITLVEIGHVQSTAAIADCISFALMPRYQTYWNCRKCFRTAIALYGDHEKVYVLQLFEKRNMKQ